MSTDPIRLNGAKFRRDKTGLIRIEIPWEVYTITDCERFVPTDAPFGLPITDRQADEWTVGTWTLTLVYEGQDGPGDADLSDANKLEVELDGSMSQDPIKSHPNFDVLKTKYGWSTEKEEFSETMPTTTGGTTTATSKDNKAKPNPLHGVDSYLCVGAIFRVTLTSNYVPGSVLSAIGTVIARPPGWEYLGVALPSGRNWLVLAPKVRRVGNTSTSTLEFMLSGPNGWVKDVYGSAQLNKGTGDAPGSGLNVTPIQSSSGL